MSSQVYAIAIDGPAGAGKSTIAKEVAHRLNYLYIDTGAMYRAITLKAHLNGIDVHSDDQLTALLEQTSIELFAKEDRPYVSVDGIDYTEQIREHSVSRLVPIVSQHLKLRKLMVQRQQMIAKNHSVVMDGRDISTVVLPQAQTKIFLTASIEERSRRRLKELEEKGANITLHAIMTDIEERDRRDREREHSPLVQAESAFLLDTTGLSIEQVISSIISLHQQYIE
jgi:cytidylate kinase